nr:alpha/beta hydrolase [uncultured Pseudogulbenkiania sp.]
MTHPRLEVMHEAAKGVARNAPPLLFLHGAFSAAWCWQEHFLPWFAEQGYDCWAPSLEGHGDSSGRNYLSGISIDDYVRNLSAVIRQIGHTPIVIGHSMGGFVLQQYLALHTLPGAVFLASVPPHGLAGSSLRLLSQAPSQFLALNLYQNGMHQPDWSELQDMLFSPAASNEVIALMARQAQQESQRAIMDMTLVNPLFIRPLPPVTALVLGAADDKLISAADVGATASRLNCTAEILPSIGHMMMLDAHWPRVGNRILEWLDQHWPQPEA